MADRHSTILNRLLGSPTQRHPRPSRDTVILLDNLEQNIPDGSIACSWTRQGGSECVFPLQHVIDYVHVKCQRNPPRPSPRVRRPHDKRSHPPDDSFFNTSSPAALLEPDPDINTRTMGKLTDDPVPLAHFLQVVAPMDLQLSASSVTEPAIRIRSATIRTRMIPGEGQTLEVNVPVRPSACPCTSFNDAPSLAAVQFAPLLGTLDLQIGICDLSIMLLALLNSIQKMEWIMSSGNNMQNVSRTVAHPPAPTPRSLEEISIAKRPYLLYCILHIRRGRHRPVLFTFVQQHLGHHT
ncbi:LOW QUALITY PROTEIN: hypothetical protein PHPALM_30619 [Phytophthora palmivora]|uniref:Uncharacterized protein n=1 Tax=Phytophthora palmivora TaxID=4796 RepID=A0A2P4X4Q0_9STRA|nr:LOW QUALITY PROTEIN: hypothetical protein PHPALM_30619 [Phytophthora palmivora]